MASEGNPVGSKWVESDSIGNRPDSVQPLASEGKSQPPLDGPIGPWFAENQEEAEIDEPVGPWFGEGQEEEEPVQAQPPPPGKVKAKLQLVKIHKKKFATIGILLLIGAIYYSTQIISDFFKTKEKSK